MALISNKKFIIILILASVIPRLITLFLLDNYGINKPIFAESQEYLQPVNNLINHSIFSSEKRVNPEPDNRYTPLYILFYLPFVYYKLPYQTVSIVQNILFAVTAVMVWLIGRKIFSEKTSRIAALLFAVEPFGLFFTNFATAQNIYYPVFTPAVLLILWWLKTDNKKLIYFSSVLFGIACLIKPVIIAVFPIALLLAVIIARKPLLPSLSILLACAAVFTIVISPWIIRNKIVLGTWQMSSVSDFNLYASNSHLFKNFFNIEDEPVVPEKYLNPSAIENIPLQETHTALGKSARDYIKKHFLKYITFHLLLAPRLFIQDGYADQIQTFYKQQLLPPEINLYSNLMRLNFLEMYNSLIKSAAYPLSAATYLLGKLIWLSLAIAAVSAGRMIFKVKNIYEKKIIIFSFLFMAGYALVFSPVGRVGYRLPINFLIFLLAVEYSFLPLWNYLSLNSKNRKTTD